jgi:DHA1 family bicyclomycin/chloramphenicol resistance-like MFS transporter
MCALVAGVLSPVLSGHMVYLALGASALTLAGWLAWRWYRHLTIQPRVPHTTTAEVEVELQTEITEPR